ncbi:MAG: hypothetical protein L6Q95_06660 [Planctomycetes bacterium]|nr:hypothetical protein [Planctomycetota bacterium]
MHANRKRPVASVLALASAGAWAQPTFHSTAAPARGLPSIARSFPTYSVPGRSSISSTTTCPYASVGA